MKRSKPPTIFFSAGEPSGDLHGANLIRQLQERCPGAAGRRLWRAENGRGRLPVARRSDRPGRDVVRPRAVESAQVLGPGQPGRSILPPPAAGRRRADRLSRASTGGSHGGRRPTAFPSSITTPPQIWAWARWRVKKMRRLVDHVLCSLPFEEPWFRQHGCNATFVGHPFFDEVRRHAMTRQFIASAPQPAGPAGGHSARLADAGSDEQPAVVSQGGGARSPRSAGRALRHGVVQAAPGRDRPADGRRRAGCRSKSASARRPS